MKLNNMKSIVLKKREVMDNELFYLLTYVDVVTKEEIKITKKIPTTKKVVIEGNNNNIVLPVIPEEIVIKGDNNTVTVEDNDLEIPYFLTKEHREVKNIAKSILKRIWNK